ncbi:MAG: hypothetical protein ACKVU2_18035 [Saprospiraceae bacterium]
MSTSSANGGPQVVIQSTSDETITLKVDGEVREIRNQLDELKALLQEKNQQNVQYADKIYNIGHIDQANFGFITGKKAFNETLTKQLVEALQPICRPAQIFLERVAATPQWETQVRISDKAKEIIAYSFAGMIGIQLSKLMAIGKEDFSETKQRKYIEKCLQIAKRSVDLVCFALISRMLDAPASTVFHLSDDLKTVLQRRFDEAFEPTLEEQFRLLQVLQAFFGDQANGLETPMPELNAIAQALQPGSDLHQTFQNLHALNGKLDKGQYDLLDCFEAETQLAAFFRYFHFLANYRMASIKQIGYRHIRNEDPRFLIRYAALGIDSKANIDAEKVNFSSDAVQTEAVLLYRGDNYRDNVNLFPFVMDYNALSFEQGSKICFYRSQAIADGSLEYLFLEDNSVISIEKKEEFPPADADFNEMLISNDNRKTLNLNSVVDQFRGARTRLLGGELNFDDI